MKPDVQKILTQLSKNQIKAQKINLSVISEAKQVVNEAGKRIDRVDKLQNKIIDKLQKIDKIAATLDSDINDLDSAKEYISEVKNSMKKIQKAAEELGADFKNIQEYRLLDSSIDVIDDLDGDNKAIKQDAKKYL